MAVLLFLLKLIGSVLLCLLAVLLICVLLLLFVPFRYRIRGSFEQEIPDGTVCASWLFHAVTFRITYHHGAAVSGDIRVFGIPVQRIEASASAAGPETTEGKEEREQ